MLRPEALALLPPQSLPLPPPLPPPPSASERSRRNIIPVQYKMLAWSRYKLRRSLLIKKMIIYVPVIGS